MTIRRTVAIVGLLLGLAPTVASTARAAGVPALIEPELTEREHAQLKSRIDERWRVVPTREGLLLVPRQPSSILKGVELAGALLYIDGKPASGADLYRRLGADAETVLELSYLSPADRADLFPAQPQAQSQAQGDSPGGQLERPRASASIISPALRELEASAQIVHGSRVRVGGSISVEEHEQVADAVAVFGSADVKGLVSGNLFTLGGDIRLGPKAVVRGDVIAVGGRVLAEPGALITGATTELGTFGTSLQWWGFDDDHALSVAVHPDWPRISRALFYTGLFAFLFWFVLAAGVLTIAPGGVARMRAEIADSPIAAFLVGAMVQVIFLPALLVLAALLTMSVVGIPLLALLPLLVCLAVIGGVMGFAGLATALGERLVGRHVPLLALLLGFVLLGGLSLIGRYVWMASPGLFGLGLGLTVIGLAVEYVTWTLGLGGATLAWLAGRRVRSAVASTTMPPPLDENPSVLTGL
jgi:hypothetical protein